MATIQRQQSRLHPELALLTPSSNDWTNTAMQLKGASVSEYEIARTASSYSSSSTSAPTLDYLTSQATTPQNSPPASVCIGLSDDGSYDEDLTKLRPVSAFDRRRSSVLDLTSQLQPKQSVRNSQSLSQLRERSRHLMRKTSSWAPNASVSPSRASERVSTYSARSLPVSRGSVKPNVLDKLPADLWGAVIERGDLSPADGAALALASKGIYEKIGFKAFRVLRRTPSRSEKLRFLGYFHHHYPDGVLCPHCLTFHNSSSPRFMDNECVKRRSPKALLFENRELSWWQVQQLVKTASDPKLHSMMVNSFQLNSRHPGGFDNRSEVRVVNGHALFKVVSRIQLRNIGRNSDAAKPPTCTHICGGTIEGHLEKVKCWWLGKKKNLMDASTVLRCERCPTEYSLTVEKKSRAFSFLRGSDVLVLTRWFDAGDGMGAASDEWFNLTYGQCDFTESENPRPRSPTKTMRSTGRKAFELGTLAPVRSRFEGDSTRLTVKSIMH